MVQEVANLLGGPVVLAKGKIDTICAQSTEARFSQADGGPRRCGGQGDVLSGVLGTVVSWATAHSHSNQVRFHSSSRAFLCPGSLASPF